MSNISIWSVDSTLSGATTPGQSGPRSNSNEVVLRAPVWQELHYQIVLYHILDTRCGGEVLPFCREVVDVFYSRRPCPRGVMLKAIDGGIVVRIPFALLCSLSDKYPWEEPLYPPRYRLNSTTNVLLKGWLWL